MKKIAEFQISELLGMAMVLVVTGIGLAYGLQILTDIDADFTEDTIEDNATEDTVDAVAKFPERLPTIASVLIASVIIGVLVTYMWGRFASR